MTVPTANVTVFPLALNVPCDALADTNISGLGSGSSTLTLSADAVPLLVTVKVNVIGSPGTPICVLPVLVKPGSATNAGVGAVAFVVVGDDVALIKVIVGVRVEVSVVVGVPAFVVVGDDVALVKVIVGVRVEVSVVVGVPVGVLVGSTCGQPKMATAKKLEKSTLALTTSPVPGAAPDGPLGLPHQFCRAFWLTVPVLLSPNAVLLAIQF